MKVNTNNVLRHNFAIWVMGRRPGWFKPQRYMYRCLRCKWAFMVNDEHSGSVRVAGDKRDINRGGDAAPARELRRGSVPGLSGGDRRGSRSRRT